MNNYILIILIMGVFLVGLNILYSMRDCPQPQIIYRYIPKTLEEEENNPTYPSEIFKTMFSQPSPWIGGVNDLDTRRSDQINKYFISQA